MNLREPTLVDMVVMACRARADEIAEYVAVRGQPWDPQAFAAELYGREGLRFGLYDANDEVIAVAGMAYVAPGIWRAWMLGSDAGWTQHWRAITKYTRRVIDDLLASGEARVIEVSTLASRTGACRWYMRGLGMQYEGTLRGRAANGSDMAVYSRIRRG